MLGSCFGFRHAVQDGNLLQTPLLAKNPLLLGSERLSARLDRTPQNQQLVRAFDAC